MVDWLFACTVRSHAYFAEIIESMTTPSPTLGERIKQLRLDAGLSMRALAEKAGLKSVAFVSDVERGFRNPSPEVLAAFAKALEVSLDDLRGYDHRAPVQEIRDITEKNPAWAMAFRRVVDAAESGVTPEQIIAILNRKLEPPASC